MGWWAGPTPFPPSSHLSATAYHLPFLAELLEVLAARGHGQHLGHHHQRVHARLARICNGRSDTQTRLSSGQGMCRMMPWPHGSVPSCLKIATTAPHGLSLSMLSISRPASSAFSHLAPGRRPMAPPLHSLCWRSSQCPRWPCLLPAQAKEGLGGAGCNTEPPRASAQVKARALYIVCLICTYERACRLDAPPLFTHPGNHNDAPIVTFKLGPSPVPGT